MRKPTADFPALSSGSADHDALAVMGVGQLAVHTRFLHAAVASEPAIRVTPRYLLRLCLLGPIELYRDDQLVGHPDLRRERVRQMLSYLAMHPRTTRQRVAAELWPDLDEEAAGRNLRVTLTYVHRVLEPDRQGCDPPYFLRAAGPALELSVGNRLTIDVHEFDRYLAEAEKAECAGSALRALPAYKSALALYRGEFCISQPDADWAALERDRLRLGYLTAAIRVGELLLADGDKHAPLVLGHAALETEPWSEAAYRLLIVTHLARGEHAHARRILVRCHTMLADLQVEPEPETQMLTRRLSGRPGLHGRRRNPYTD
jgi:LuxR family transcriptional regulator, maltose regulon positive regulatory protein